MQGWLGYKYEYPKRFVGFFSRSGTGMLQGTPSVLTLLLTHGFDVADRCVSLPPGACCWRTLPRAQVFAALAGVPVMVQKKPYEERLGEFRPFTCSDFIIPMLAKLCPEDDKVDRYIHTRVPPVSKRR